MKFAVTEKGDYLLVDVSGDMTPMNLMELYKANAHTDQDRIIDLSQAEIDINMAEYQSFLTGLVNSKHNQRTGYRVAVVFDQNFEEAFAHIVQMANSESLNNPIRVFFLLEEAIDWLTRPAAPKTIMQKLKSFWS